MEINNCENFKLYNSISLRLEQTIMFWIKMDNNRFQREFIIGCNPYKFSIVIEKSKSNQISYYCGDKSLENGDAYYKAYTGRLPYDKYQHITFVRNQNSVKVYINCKLLRTYNFNFEKINLECDNISIGSSNSHFLTNLSQPIKNIKIINEELNASDILKSANNFFKDYYTNNYNIFSFFFFSGDLNYRFNYNDYTYIFSENKLIKYKDSNSSLFKSIVKFNSNTDDYNNLIIKNTSYDISYFIDDKNISLYITNILTWQFGMYQNTNPKDIPEDKLDCYGSWPCDVTNFFIPYQNKDDIKYVRGSFQEGVGTWVKMIINYYLENKESNLGIDCLQSTTLFVDFMNRSRYVNGGIPLYYPLTGKYHDMITINDCNMVNYLRCCEFILNSDIKNDISAEKILLLKENYDNTFNCLINLQYVINDKKTIWPQQADINTLLPAQGRSFEKESICSLESVQILIYLMSLPNQTEIVKNSIISGCEWFKTHSISGYKQYYLNGALTLSKENNHKLLWSRYYTLDTQEPIFFDRDGNEYSLENFNNIPVERRNGYTWLGCWGNYLLEVYSFWKTINLN